MVNNPYSEDWTLEVTVSEGEVKSLTPALVPKKADFVINPLLPEACSFTVGTMRYPPGSAYREFPLRDYPADTPVVFDCPAPIGKRRTVLGKNEPGGSYILPTTLDLLEPDP